MRDLSADTFRQHLLDKYSLPARARARVQNPANSTLTRPLRELWEATDLSAAEFADEVSNYFGVVRLGLPQLLAATPCLDGFSRRFLRESTIFPFRAPNGGYRIAVAHPSDTAAIAPPRSCSGRASRSPLRPSRTSPPCSTSASSR